MAIPRSHGICCIKPMHTITIRSKFTFGDRVRFDSKAQHRSGTGTVFAITMAHDGQIDYIIEIPMGGYSDLQPGIYENEMILLVKETP